MTGRRLPALWLARIADLLPAGASAWLDRSECERLARFPLADERRRRVTAWCLRRWALSQRHPEVAMADWRFEAGRYGKPELAPAFGALGLHHSSSHGGDYAAVLIAGEPCGVDIEGPVTGLEALDVAFTPGERTAILLAPDPRRTFLQHWVAKEALLKREGSGFAIAPDSVGVTLSGDGRSARAMGAPEHPAHPWRDTRIALWPIGTDHWLAAALQASTAVPKPVMAAWQPS